MSDIKTNGYTIHETDPDRCGVCANRPEGITRNTCAACETTDRFVYADTLACEAFERNE